MRVAHLTTVDMSLRYLVLPQLLDIRDRGGEAIGISSPGPFVDQIEAFGVHHLELPSSTRGMRPIADVRAAWNLWSILRREQLDVLHTHNPKPGLYGRVLGRLAGVPVVANTVHGLYATEDDRAAKRALVYGLEAIAARFSDVELIQSHEDLSLMTRTHISPPHKTRLLGNGVDVSRFRPDVPDAESRLRFRAEMGIAPDSIVVGMVGRLVAEKGWLEMFDAVERLGPGYTCLAVGPEDPDKADSIPPSALSTAEQYGVQLLGMRTDMVELYGAMDVFALPSHREGFPRAAMEAAASGVPIVASDIRGCREVVEDGVNGYLIPVGDADALAAAIVQLAASPERRAEMGEAGRRKAEAEFDERRVVERVRHAYVSAYRRRGTASPPQLLDAQAVTNVRAAERGDVAFLAGLHPRHNRSRAFGGTWFLRRAYEALIGYQGAVVLVAEDAAGPLGFAAAVDDLGRFRRAALMATLRSAGFVAAWRGAHRGRRRSPAGGRLLALSVAPEPGAAATATRLGKRLLSLMERRGVRTVSAPLPAADSGGRAVLASLGFSAAGGDSGRDGSDDLIWVAPLTDSELPSEG
jgi:glycosyltransferase involved in cell wall biosynthesis